ncbi:potassium transporter 6-like [Phragmites australis]|uniref:potassium transporter 6-like n=1 Tax=Phragmites australis TaxID=29695 RepID=UPI002D77C324|nr:potassium transporter 6-like [Phragmites australis]
MMQPAAADLIVEIGAAENDEVADDERNGGAARRTFSFSQAYKMRHREPMVFTKWQTMLLAYQSLGIVYGDLGTSPLYVFSSLVLPDAGETDFLGVLSLILWTLTIVSLVKYVFIVLRADDHGEGGTFALYSLLRQHVNFKANMPVPVTPLASDVNLKFHGEKRGSPSKLHQWLESSSMLQSAVTYFVLFGTCMTMGDGALTPSISVLSAVQGIQSRSSSIKQGHVVILSVVILLLLFLVQRFGTSKVSSSFSPIMLVWFGSIAVIGVYNIAKHYPPVLKAVSPHYIYYYFARNKRVGWEQLGAVILCITGAEAMFADLGHFNKSSIQVAFSTLVYPSLILAYSGQAAYLIKNPSQLSTTFYSSIPEPLFWPMFVVATLSAIVASQSLISASFSIIRQSVALGCFPRVTIRHTSEEYEGQVYSPEINYFLMVVCILITVGFGGGPEIGRAFGVAVIFVMLITTHLMTIVMLVIWKVHIALATWFFSAYVAFEGVYTSALMNKVAEGGWVPFAVAAFLLVPTLAWTYGRKLKAEYEARHAVGAAELSALVARSARVPGVCVFCTDLVNGFPPIVRRYAEHARCLRELTLFVTVRDVPVRSVLPEERFLVAREEPAGVYRCVVRYGYMDKHDLVGDGFVGSAIAALKEIAESAEEAEMMVSALEDGYMFVFGRTILHMGSEHNWFKRLVTNDIYRFLQKNFRSSVSTLNIDQAKTLHVGMLYEI